MGIAAKICFIVTIVIGVLALIFSIAMVSGGYDKLFNLVLHKKTTLKEGGAIYDFWRTTPVPMSLKAYFFNLTNPDEFVKGAMPILNEIGPYIYSEFHEKQNITFHSNQTVTYYQERWWYWNSEDPLGRDPTELITSVNIVPVTAAFIVESNALLLTSLDTFFRQFDEQLIITKTAQEFLFDGFEDPLLNFVQANVVNENGTFNWVNSVFDIPPKLANYDKFGWFYSRNHSYTYDGAFSMYTGESGLQDVGKIDLWNFKNETNYFSSPCNAVKGTTGEIFPPGGVGRDYIEFYTPDLCMTLKLYYQKDIYDSYGIAGYRFYGSNVTFTNQTYIPGNQCYCIKGICAPTGLLNAQTCRLGAPAFISFPHFYNADPELLEHVSGLRPNQEIHQLYLDLNPDLGAPLEVAARMQVNIHIKPYSGILGSIQMLKKVPDVMLPLFWFEIKTALTENLASQVKLIIFLQDSVLPIVLFSILIVVELIVLLGTVLWFYKSKGHCKGDANFTKYNSK